MLNKKLTFVTTLLALAPLAGAPAQEIYQSSFESANDPSGTSYQAAVSLGGQGGWILEEGVATVATDSSPAAPAVPGISPNVNVVQQGASSSISRDIPANSGSTVLFRGYYLGSGVDPLEIPDADPPMAAALGFHSLSPTTLQIEGFNGTSFVAPNGVDPLPNDQWHEIVMLLDYNSQTYSVSVNNTPYLSDIPFSSSIAQLNGFRSSTEVGSSLDTIGFFDTDGDFDDDGISDIDEMNTPGGNALDINAPNPLLDTDQDGRPDICESTEDGVLAVAANQITHALLPDSDGDGLLDGEESNFGCALQTGTPLAQTNPRDADSDDDGFTDGMEVLVLGTDPLDPNDPDKSLPAFADADGDGLPASFDPDDNNIDTDGDRYRDGYEAQYGADPNDADSKPSLADSNGNGAITVADVTLLKQVIQGLTPGSAQIKNMDTTLNGRLGATDVTREKQYIADPDRKIP